MASWWRKIALQVGTGAGSGSWERRAAFALGAQGQTGQSWPRRIARLRGTQQNVGSWTRRLTPLNATGKGPWARRLYNSASLVTAGDTSYIATFLSMGQY